MILNVWHGNDYADREIPDEMLRPLLQHLLRNREWYANMDFLARLVRQMKLAVQEHIDLEDQAELVTAHTIVNQAEEGATPSASEAWDHPESAVPVPHGQPRSATALRKRGK